ncbi:MAG: putative colanic acid biosynthesis UDP-glucose lipid carrier transferase, partial [Psychroserpens sp.]
MSLFKHGRYSGYLRPISYLIDLSIINGFAILYFFINIDPIKFMIFSFIAWIILSVYSKFYEVYRYTREVKIYSLILTQLILFTLIIFAFSGYYYNLNIYPITIFKYVLSVFLCIAFFKFAIYYLLQKYRVSFGGNFRRTVIIGENKKTKALETFFNKNPEYGYVHVNTFNLKDRKIINLQSQFDYIKKEEIDEIYCSISELTNQQILEIADFADNNLKILKFLPDNKDIYSKKLRYEYYDYIPILSLRTIPL